MKDSREMLVDRYDGSVSGLRRILQVMCETMWEKKRSGINTAFKGWFLRKGFGVGPRVICNHTAVPKSKDAYPLQPVLLIMNLSWPTRLKWEAKPTPLQILLWTPFQRKVWIVFMNNCLVAYWYRSRIVKDILILNISSLRSNNSLNSSFHASNRSIDWFLIC